MMIDNLDSLRRAIAKVMFAMVLIAPAVAWPQVEGQGATSAVVASNFAPALTNRPAPRAVAAPAPVRKRAGFLAGAGLVILSLLILGTGLALVRAFKQS